MNLFNQTVPLDSFFSDLIKDLAIQNELKAGLGDQIGNSIINQLLEGIPFEGIEGNWYDLISDFIHNEAKEVETILGEGSYGEFPISVLNYGPVFWIEAQEFDSIGYFRSKDDAVSCAEWEYMEYLEGDNEEDNED
ncbi:hypothetical protein [Algoriphagus limi]|uniref:SMI1 / KNR4 family (SUKH-1) n=1 Tax=Algoriphagus limi TaxID=2975273 RepID=A0ABT2G155_9BACT|nr:hypothetical protein [Algoriphagus limi]MCS5488909.1 hypothetical protein [Algoriphagus limi]